MLRSRGTTELGAASLEVTKMRRRHLRGVMAIERQAYARPWTPNLFVAEMSEPNNRNYLVARIDKDVVGYAGLICYGDEAHITNIAVEPMLQGHGIAHRLLAEEIDAARGMGATAVSLEVRVTNCGRNGCTRGSGSIRSGSVATTTPSCTRTRSSCGPTTSASVPSGNG